MAASRSAHQDEPFHRTKIKKRNESIYAVREDTTGKRIGTACAVKKITETTKEYCLLSWNKIGQNGAQEMIADRYSHKFSKHNAKHSVKIAKPAEEDGLSYFQLNCRPNNCLNLVEHNLSQQELKVVKAGFSVYTFMERGVIQLDFKLNCGKYELIKIQPEQSGFDERFAIGAPIIIEQGRRRKDTVIGVLGMSTSGNLIPIFHRDAGVDFEEERPVENIREQSGVPLEKELDDLAQEITDCWQSLGIQLGLKSATVDSITANNIEYPSPEQKSFCMLITWRTTGSSSYIKLWDALNHLGRQDLAEKYCSRKVVEQYDVHVHAPPASRKRKLNTSSGSASPAPSIPSHSPEETGINPKERRTSSALFKEIREEYQRRSKRLQVFPWCKTKQPLTDNIYTKLKILVRSNETGQLTSEIVNMNEIFKPHEECGSPKLVLIEGDPGMGKTTFCRKLSLDWSRKKIEAPFPQFQLVLLLMCRDLKTADIRKAITDQLLPRSATEEETEAFFRELQETQSDVLLILDGLDELKEHVAAEDLVDARKRNVLRNSYVLVTSRHNAEVRERCDTLLETVGFTKEDAEEYIRKYFKEEKAEDLLEKISRSGPLKELLFNPLNTALICAVFEDNGDLPSARTQLYDKIVHCILKGFYSKQGKVLPKQPIDACKKELMEIGKFALRGLIEGKLSFEESKLESGSETIASMGFLSKEESTDKVDPKSLLCFMHKTFQEYFAGLYLSDQIINKEVTVEDLIQELSTERETFAEVFIFIAGFLAGKGAGANAGLVLFMENLSYRLSTLYTLTADASIDIHQWQKQSDTVTSSFLLLCNCVAECSDGQQLNKLQKELCSIIGRNISWEEVWLSFSSISESSVVYIVLCEILKHNSTIKKLNLPGNKISDCRLLAESLKQNSTLEELNLTGNKISDCRLLAESLKQNSTLEWLDLSHNKISDCRLLAESLNQNKTLEVLNLSNNNISDCRLLAESLNQNSTLEELDLLLNPISDKTPLEELKRHNKHLILWY